MKYVFDARECTPEEGERKELIITMRIVTSNGLRDMDYQLARYFEAQIRKGIAEKSEYKLIYTPASVIKSLAENLARTSGVFPIEVLPYDALLQVWKSQPDRIKKIGVIDKKEAFALVDEEARQIGVYIPKTVRQYQIERSVDDALADLERFIHRRGGTSNPRVRTLLKDYMMRQVYPHWIPSMKIIACKGPLHEEKFDEIYLSGKHVIQVSFNPNTGMMYYHIL